MTFKQRFARWAKRFGGFDLGGWNAKIMRLAYNWGWHDAKTMVCRWTLDGNGFWRPGCRRQSPQGQNPIRYGYVRCGYCGGKIKEAK